MKRILLALPLIASALAQPAFAHQMGACDSLGVGIDSINVPAAKNSRNFGDGAISIYNIDTIEPAAASSGIAITLPDTQSEVGGTKCVAVIGFANIDVMKAQASYDSSKGLLLVLPTFVPAEDGSGPIKGAPLKLRINQKTATVVQE